MNKDGNTDNESRPCEYCHGTGRIKKESTTFFGIIGLLATIAAMLYLVFRT